MISGQAIEEAGHYWVGCDISKSMLNVAAESELTLLPLIYTLTYTYIHIHTYIHIYIHKGDSDTGDLVEADMGQGLPFRPGTFDGVISISAIQWYHLYIHTHT